MAGEFPADTNYLYATYHADAFDVAPSRHKKILILGSGTYRIGSSVEFDWCAVNAAAGGSELGYETIMVNYNPETVSTDYDICDRLVFRRNQSRDRPRSVRTRTPRRRRRQHGRPDSEQAGHAAGQRRSHDPRYSAESIDKAEDRAKFSALLDELGIEQPRWVHITDDVTPIESSRKSGGFPVLVRPSYVLSGAAMKVAHEPIELRHPRPCTAVSPGTSGRHLQIRDARARSRDRRVADHGQLVLWAISEHVEDAGVHSGDATLVLPPQTLYIATIRRVRHFAELARALQITGPFNVQFLARNNVVKVIECNLRASRSFPFVSKVLGENFAAEATRRMLGVSERTVNPLELNYVAVKAPMFSFSRLVGADPMLGVEMVSTGEVGCVGRDLNDALLHGLLATGSDFRPGRAAVARAEGRQVQVRR